MEGDSIRVVTAPVIRAGDRLLLVPGDLLPVASELLDSTGEISTDWITGESRPTSVDLGSTLPAGAFNAGRTTMRVRATENWSESRLISLLSSRRVDAMSGRSAIVARISRFYVPVVLLLSGIGLLLWRSAGLPAALDVTVALLVVTCPCAIGIAIPLAEELAFARLRRTGVFVRSADLLDRLLRIDAVVFDLCSIRPERSRSDSWFWTIRVR
jgi:Cu2+-exporting ATPase